jgi:hypothetical protein
VHFCHHLTAHWHVSRLFFFLLSTWLLFSLFLLTFHFWKFDTFIYQKSEINSREGI